MKPGNVQDSWSNLHQKDKHWWQELPTSDFMFLAVAAFQVSHSGFLIHFKLFCEGDIYGSNFIHSDWKAIWYHCKSRYVDQWNWTEDWIVGTCNYSHLIVDKDTKDTHWKKYSIFNKQCWENWLSTHARRKLGPCLSP